MTTWIVQNNLNPTGGVDTFDIIARACAAAQCPLISIEVTPFSNDLPAIPHIEWPFVFYGYSTLITNVKRAPYWEAGVFFDPELFRPSEYARRYGDLYLNSDMEFMTFEDLASRSISSNVPLFVRPNDDLKQWTGSVMTFGEYSALFSSLDPTRRDSQVAVSSPKIIEAEWRVFVVDGHVVASSQYRPQALAWVPPDVAEFAGRVARTWSPVPIFVIDIARAGSGLKIVELNCFNGSSFYSANAIHIVRGVSNYLDTLSGPSLST